MQETGENLFDVCFENITDDRMKAYVLKSGTQRTDSKQYPSHDAVATVNRKKGNELTADSLQFPDDLEATFRKKRGESYVGYVANITETVEADNPFQWIAGRITRYPILKSQTSQKSLAFLTPTESHNSPNHG